MGQDGIHFRLIRRCLTKHRLHREAFQAIVAHQFVQVSFGEDAIDTVDTAEIIPQGIPRGEIVRGVELLALCAHHHHIAILAEGAEEALILHIGAIGLGQQTAMLVVHLHLGGVVPKEYGTQGHRDQDRDPVA